MKQEPGYGAFALVALIGFATHVALRKEGHMALQDLASLTEWVVLRLR